MIRIIIDIVWSDDETLYPVKGLYKGYSNRYKKFTYRIKNNRII